MSSEECDDKHDQIVTLLYRIALRRDPDPEGLAAYVNRLRDGQRVETILFELSNSTEYKSQVKLYVPPGHFYSPIVNPAEADAHLRRKESCADQSQLPGIVVDLLAMGREFRSFGPFLREMPFTHSASAPFRYRFDNDAYSWMDASVLYCMLRKYRPKRLVEIGSGWSSACTIDTLERFLPGHCEVTFIEPHPQLLSELVGHSSERIKLYDCPVQEVDLSVFSTLEDGDFLFIDSTHVVKTGSDVCYEMFEVLPTLKPGVHVHFHDVFWPFEYPRSWAVEENKSWNEIYLLRAFLQENDRWRITFFNDFFAKHSGDLITSIYPDLLRNTGGALWLQKLL